MAMTFLDYGHNPLLVAMSLVVALVAGFTGLSLTKDLSQKSVAQKQVAVSLAAIALGGGIWSMHFVAMLGMQLPILFYYDAAITLASALVAILIVAAALVILHFTHRTPGRIVLAGTIVGIGILMMHYIGMAGLQLCRAVYTPAGLVLSSIAAVALCILAFGVAYGKRNNRNIVLGTTCFGLAVFLVHFLAMAGTNFVSEPNPAEFGPSISNEVMALGVILSSFVIFGAFLWVGTTYLVPGERNARVAVTTVAGMPRGEPLETAGNMASAGGLAIPCEKDGGKVFLSSRDIAFVRADGHYTQVYTDTERFFCVWPITEASKRLCDTGFLKVHRSYLVNPAKVARFDRTKDKGLCTFTSTSVPHAPVSRSNLKAVQVALATQVGAVRAV